MYTKWLLALLLLLCIVELSQQQRSAFRRRRPVQKEEEEEVEVQEEPATPTRQSGRRAIGNRRPGAAVVGGGRRRGGLLRDRFRPPAGRLPPRVRRPPFRMRPSYDYYYDYYSYYEDPLYEADYAYEEEEEPVPKKSSGAGGGGEGGVDTQLLSKLLSALSGGDSGGAASQSESEPEEEYECPPDEYESYYTPDEQQCDKYFECNIKGQLREHICPDGWVFEVEREECDIPVKVNCSTRPILQEPQPSTNCSRANGYFVVPANISCQQFYHCSEGRANLQTCPGGTIFDPQLNSCTSPDQSSRTECTHGANRFLDYDCPEYNDLSVLRFGNHERLPHPKDCRLYFSCLKFGGPRLASCGRLKVFNNGTGYCDDPENVKGCETYWIDKLAEDGDYLDQEFDYTG